MKDYRGTTVLITGASSGLGAEFARRLASRGANLVLVARRRDRLEDLAAELMAKHGIGATVVAADLAKPGAVTALARELGDMGVQIDSLINNAGFATRNAFKDEDAERIAEEVDLNVGALVALTRQFYPRMLAEGRGILVNIASTAAYQPVPHMAVYGATKAFVLSFTEALWYEAKGSGLSVLALSPGATETEFFDVVGRDAQVGGMKTPAEVVELALSTLDKRAPGPSVISGTRNALTATMTRLLSRRALANVSGRVTAG
ncbi:SDR family NAD(P)-dependent oxidoreductase [Leifsonia sp. AG29]|uniref:SDR family NAD(P)-dependent oxidoreductase n=1 Tax=Leifsonia sp. AG29 TaxID=2598860 RepID=UPI00131BDCB6|nr:SDR family oxidoreductase [Leifsonia sp. AG29]